MISRRLMFWLSNSPVLWLDSCLQRTAMFQRVTQQQRRRCSFFHPHIITKNIYSYTKNHSNSLAKEYSKIFRANSWLVVETWVFSGILTCFRKPGFSWENLGCPWTKRKIDFSSFCAYQPPYRNICCNWHTQHKLWLGLIIACKNASGVILDAQLLQMLF